MIMRMIVIMMIVKIMIMRMIVIRMIVKIMIMAKDITYQIYNHNDNESNVDDIQRYQTQQSQ